MRISSLALPIVLLSEPALARGPELPRQVDVGPISATKEMDGLTELTQLSMQLARCMETMEPQPSHRGILNDHADPTKKFQATISGFGTLPGGEQSSHGFIMRGACWQSDYAGCATSHTFLMDNSADVDPRTRSFYGDGIHGYYLFKDNQPSQPTPEILRGIFAAELRTALDYCQQKN